jgi:hypothetical protein
LLLIRSEQCLRAAIGRRGKQFEGAAMVGGHLLRIAGRAVGPQAPRLGGIRERLVSRSVDPDGPSTPPRMELAPPWDAPSYRAIEMKIGEELRERYEPPPGLPDQLLTLLMKLERPHSRRSRRRSRSRRSGTVERLPGFGALRLVRELEPRLSHDVQDVLHREIAARVVGHLDALCRVGSAFLRIDHVGAPTCARIRRTDRRACRFIFRVDRVQLNSG